MVSGQTQKNSKPYIKKSQKFKPVDGKSSVKNKECGIYNSSVEIDQKGLNARYVNIGFMPIMLTLKIMCMRF